MANKLGRQKMEILEKNTEILKKLKNVIEMRNLSRKEISEKHLEVHKTHLNNLLRNIGKTNVSKNLYAKMEAFLRRYETLNEIETPSPQTPKPQTQTQRPVVRKDLFDVEELLEHLKNGEKIYLDDECKHYVIENNLLVLKTSNERIISINPAIPTDKKFYIMVKKPIVLTQGKTYKTTNNEKAVYLGEIAEDYIFAILGETEMTYVERSNLEDFILEELR